MIIADTWPAARVFAWHAWAIESDPWLNVERRGDGYIAQHASLRTPDS